MRAMFANLTAADFRGRWKKEPRSVERQRVHVLFDEIQIAIYNDDRARLEFSWWNSLSRRPNRGARIQLMRDGHRCRPESWPTRPGVACEFVPPLSVARSETCRTRSDCGVGPSDRRRTRA